MTKGYGEFKAEAARRRAGMSEVDLDLAAAVMKAQREEIEALRKALAFYADKENWYNRMPNPEWYEELSLAVLDDRGAIARAALKSQ